MGARTGGRACRGRDVLRACRAPSSAARPRRPPLDQAAHYQVALIRNDRPGDASGQFCGGSVRRRDDRRTSSPRRTASSTTPRRPGAADRSGESRRPRRHAEARPPSGGHRRARRAVSIDPTTTRDALARRGRAHARRHARPTGPRGPADRLRRRRPSWAPPSPGTTAVVSGWGRIDSGDLPQRPALGADAVRRPIRAVRRAGPSTGVRHVGHGVRRRSPTNDSCFGDSGGPLVSRRSVQ